MPSSPVRAAIRVFAGAASLHVALLAVLAATARGDDVKAKTDALSDEAFDAALAAAYEAKPDGAEFIPSVQQAAPRFQLVDASTEPGQGAWTVVTLNARGKRIDGVRFRVPEGEKRDLLWAFAQPKALAQWYVVPVEGRMPAGFRSFKKVKATALFGNDAAEPDAPGVLQALAGDNLEPGKEYVLWFMFRDEAPAEVPMALALLPAQRNVRDAAAEKALGLPKPLPKAEDAAAGTGTVEREGEPAQ
jgi:hypothetical protein